MCAAPDEALSCVRLACRRGALAHCGGLQLAGGRLSGRRAGGASALQPPATILPPHACTLPCARGSDPSRGAQLICPLPHGRFTTRLTSAPRQQSASAACSGSSTSCSFRCACRKPPLSCAGWCAHLLPGCQWWLTGWDTRGRGLQGIVAPVAVAGQARPSACSSPPCILRS